MRTLLYRNFRLLILCIVLIALWGYASFQGLPRLEDPELTQRAAVVQTFFPGASADRVEALVTEKIEEEIATVKEILTYESTSRAGASTVIIELNESLGPDQVDGVWSKVRDKLRNAEPLLPVGSTEPELDEIEIRAYAMLVGLTWEQDEQPNYAILQRRAQALEDELRSLPGTEVVNTFGAPDEEIAVEISPQQLAALGLTTQQIAQQIQQSDSKGAAGQLRGDSELVLEVAGELNSLEQIRQIPLRQGVGSSGQFARLGDVAQVQKGIVEPPSTLSRVSDRPGIVLGVYVESGYRLDLWTASARKVLDAFQSQLPSGIGMNVMQEQNRYVSDRLRQLFSSLILGAGLLFIVTVVMMGLQSALVIELTLVLCVLIVFGLMSLLGVPLHQMSVMGLIVSLGLLIDNAIIVVDDIQNRLRTGQRNSQAVSDSMGYLASPLTAGTLTTVLAFMPIALLTGSIGEFIGTLGLNVILAVLASLMVALTITPVLVARINNGWQRLWGSGSFGRWSRRGISNTTMTRWYSKTLQWSLARPLLAILLSLLLPLSGFLAATTLDLQFFPAADRDQMQIQIELPTTRSLAQTQATVSAVRDRLLEHSEIQDIHWFLGESSPRIYYNQVGSREGEASYANGIVQLSDVVPNAWIRDTQQELDAAFPDSRILLRWFEQGPPFDAPIELRIYGPDLDVLQTLGDETRALLSQLPTVTHTRALLGESLPQLSVQVDETAARSRGLSQADIAQQLNTTLEGATGGSVLEGNEELPVRVRLPNADRASLDQIASLNLLLPNGSNRGELNATPLNALGSLSLEPKRSAITRRDGIRVNTVQGFIQAGSLPANVLMEFQQLLDQSLVIPPGYRLSFGGEAEERGEAVGNLLASVGVLVVLMVATLVLSLGSFRLAAVIGAIAFLSIGLGLLSEWVWGFPLGFNPIIGIIGLIGVAVNDSITVLTALKSDPHASQGHAQAIREVVLHSTRHVLTTTLTTILGFAPLILGGGAFWPPLAVAIAGGVAGATILALYFIPAVYLLLTRGKTADKLPPRHNPEVSAPVLRSKLNTLKL